MHDANTGHTADITAGGRVKVESAGITDTLTTGTITSGSGANSYVEVPYTALENGQSSFTVDLHPSGPGWSSGTTVVIEGTLDDVDWATVHVFDLTQASSHTGSFVGPGPYTARGVCGGFYKLRARASAYSGTDRVAVKFRTTVADTATAVINFPATQAVSGTVNVGNLPATQPVSGTVAVSNFPATQAVSFTRSLTERMMARAPQANYSLYLDTADATYIYIAEGPTADTAASATAQGIRVTKDASGNPLGRVEIATGFAWNSRSSATWA